MFTYIYIHEAFRFSAPPPHFVLKYIIISLPEIYQTQPIWTPVWLNVWSVINPPLLWDFRFGQLCQISQLRIRQAVCSGDFQLSRILFREQASRSWVLQGFPLHPKRTRLSVPFPLREGERKERERLAHRRPSGNMTLTPSLPQPVKFSGWKRHGCALQTVYFPVL